MWEFLITAGVFWCLGYFHDYARDGLMWAFHKLFPPTTV